jgi:hypothetical protein
MQGKQAKLISLTHAQAMLGSLATTRYLTRDRVMFLVSMKALVGCQGRDCTDIVQPDFYHSPLLQALLFPWPSKHVTMFGPRWNISPRNPIRVHHRS